ncbi:MAG: hypothetical protein Q4G62_11235 [Pseudomonadota bacterium]|nr:hypothetical protein [Pseudomonadota bacterium]
MRIKRYTANDMRSALRMVREQQGPDAVILSSKTGPEGVEVVAALDYDEALVQRTLQACRQPAASAAKPTDDAQAEAIASAPRTPSRIEQLIDAVRNRSGQTSTSEAPAAPAIAQRTNQEPTFADWLAQASAKQTSPGSNALSSFAADDDILLPPRKSAISGGQKAVFIAADDIIPAASEAAIAPAHETAPVSAAPAIIEAEIAAEINAAIDANIETPAAEAPVIAHAAAETAPTAHAERSPLKLELEPLEISAPAAPSNDEAERPALTLVPNTEAAPSIALMREELAQMRQMMERQVQDLAHERMRVSPARAAVYDGLLEHGIDAAQAQHIATRIDPAMDPTTAQERMLSEFVRLIPLPQGELLDNGGVFALLGPSSAGKTSAAAKLAARYAQQHGSRDVALVSFDSRPAASEALHRHGRQLGVLVREASTLDELDAVLTQLAAYPLVLIDTPANAIRHREIRERLTGFKQSNGLQILLALPAQTNPHDLDDLIHQHRDLAPAAAVLTKCDETCRIGSALSVLIRHGLPLAYGSDGADNTSDIESIDRTRLTIRLKGARRPATPQRIGNAHVIA